MTRKEKLVQGAGINDAEYPVTIRALIGGRQNILWVCPFYKAWSRMLERCYSSKFQTRCPTYIGCEVAPEWLLFSGFRSWMMSLDWDGLELDKDLLVPGNKLYGPDTCVFVSRQLNTFMTDRGAARGEWPIGVRLHKQSGRYESRCRNPFTGKQGQLGLFACPDAAHEAWRRRKHEHACTYAEQQTDPRVAAALRARYVEIKEVK